MYSRTKSTVNRSGKLSQSALNYLQSLEKNSKALRQGQIDDEVTVRSPSKPSLLESSRRSSELGSLSSMIVQLRQKARRESQKEESEDDELNESFGRRVSSVFVRESSDSLSNENGERVILDFPNDEDSDHDPLQVSIMPSHFLPKERPGSHVGRKSIHEIRELRNSIDQSLMKPPKLEKRSTKVNTQKKNENFETMDNHEDNSKVSMSVQEKGRSPFHNVVESGSSDLESLDFEISEEVPEHINNSGSVRFEDNFRNTSPSSALSMKFSLSKSLSTSSKSSPTPSKSSPTPSKSSPTSSKSSPTSSKSSPTSSKSSPTSSKSSPTSSKSSPTSSKSSPTSSKSSPTPSSKPSSGLLQSSSPLTTPKSSYSSSKSLSSRKKLSGKSSPSPSFSSIHPAEVSKTIYSSDSVYSRLLNNSKINSGILKSRSIMVSPEHASRAFSSERSSMSFKNLEKEFLSNAAVAQIQDYTAKSMISSDDYNFANNEYSMVTKNNGYKKQAFNEVEDYQSQLDIREIGTQTSERKNTRIMGRTDVPEKDFSSSNLHALMIDVMKTHLDLIKEFNRMEWESLKDWNANLTELRTKYRGNAVENLENVIGRRLESYNKK